LKKFYEAHRNDTRFSFIEFPIKQLHGESAILAARASLAARHQPARYMDFHFALLGKEDTITEEDVYAEAARAGLDVNKLKADMADPGIEKTLKSSIDLAHKAGVDGTPTFIFNGKFRPGMVDDETLAKEMKS
jgi:protein-disulfide isomerase